jgi:hypothetical protein
MSPEALTEGTCSCFGSDASRFEFFLDNGFGFELHAKDEAGVSWGKGETEPSDFAGFYLERRGFFAIWLMETEDELGSAEHEVWGALARAAFARGIEHEAHELGIDFTAADVATDLIEIEIEMRIVFGRLGPLASVEEIAAEYMNMIRHGLTAEEAALVTRLREGIAGAIRQSPNELSQQIGKRLRDPRRSHFSFRRWRVATGPTVTRTRRSGVRTPRARRRVQRARARSPGRPEPEPEPPAVARLRGLVRVLAGRR